MEERRYRDNLFVLGLLPGATLKEIEKAAKIKRSQWHPDKNRIDLSDEEKQERHERYMEIDKAYDELISHHSSGEAEIDASKKEHPAVHRHPKVIRTIVADKNGYINDSLTLAPDSIASIMARFHAKK